MRHVLSILFGAGFTAATAWALGRIAFNRLKVRLEGLEHDLLAGTAGAAILSVLIFSLCALQVAYAGVFTALGAIALCANYRLKTAPLRGLRAATGIWLWAWLAVSAVYAYVYLVNSVAPEYSPDGQTYHLGLVYRFYREHGFHRITTSFYANMPLGAEMLFLSAFAHGRQSAAATLECCSLLVLPFLMACYGRRIGHPAAGAAAGLLVFLSPIAGFAGTTAYNDILLTTASFATFYLVEIWRDDTENRGLAIVAGLTAGFCLGIKYTGFPAILYMAAVMLWKRKPKALLMAVCAMAVIAGPWLVKNWLWVGNPVAPFLNRVFPNPYVHVAFEDFTRTWFRRYDIPDLRPLFWMVTVTGRVAGQLGPWFLLAPIGLISMIWPAGRRLLFAVAVFLIPYPQNIAARFLLPAAPFVALTMVLVLEQARLVTPVVVAAAAILAWPRITAKYETGGNVRITGVPLKAALRKIPQDQFLAEHSVPWITGQMLDTYVPAGQRVLSTTPVGEGYAKTDVMVTYQSGEGDLLQDFLSTANDAALQPTRNLRFTFPVRKTTHVRLAQTADDSGDVWSIGELIFFSGNREIRPLRLDATPFPFDINLAQDRNPVTRWKAWQPLRSGMHVDAFFAQGTSIDRIELHCSHDQGKLAVHPQTCVDTRCQSLESGLEELETPPVADIRALATQEIRRHGISYLMIDDGNWVAADIRRDTERWHMKFISERAGNRLYMLY